MKIGIVGRRGSGKTSIFSLLTGGHRPVQSNGYSIGMASVPDTRVEFLSQMYKPKKTTYAQMSVVDFAAAGHKDQETSRQAKSVDALLLVLGAFLAEPEKEFGDALLDLILSDLEQVERSLERLKSKRFSSEEHVAGLEQIKQMLEQGLLIPEQYHELADLYNLITHKPVIAALNVSEEDICLNGELSGTLEVRAADLGIPVVRFSALIEEEIAQMSSQEERRAFLEMYQLERSGIQRLAATAYTTLGLVSFFTVGQDEVKAWTLKDGSAAKQAAGIIHSDIERGFIRAEVVSYDDLHRLGSMKAVKEAGLFRLESKQYRVSDGDIISFRFNV